MYQKLTILLKRQQNIWSSTTCCYGLLLYCRLLRGSLSALATNTLINFFSYEVSSKIDAFYTGGKVQVNFRLIVCLSRFMGLWVYGLFYLLQLWTNSIILNTIILYERTCICLDLSHNKLTDLILIFLVLIQGRPLILYVQWQGSSCSRWNWQGCSYTARGNQQN